MSNHRLIFANASGLVRVAIPTEPVLPGEPEAVWLERVAFRLAHANPGMDGWTYRGSVLASALPPRDTVRLPGAPTYPLPNGENEERYLHYRQCWAWQSGQGVRLAPGLLRQQFLQTVREERNRRLLDSDGKRGQLEDTATSGRVAAFKAYRQQLRDLPAAVTNGLAGLTFSGMLSYTPPWPVDPEA